MAKKTSTSEADLYHIKESSYNYFQKDPSGKAIAYNFLYRSMLSFDRKEFEEVKRILERLKKNSGTPPAGKIFSTLLEHKFIINKHFEEMEFIRHNYFKSLYNDSVLTTMLLPTLDCNFKCPYCFEYKKKITMTDEMVDAYINWVKSKLANKRHFHITWFGGEPLLCFDKMKKITKELKGACKRNNCGFSASITTNGYYLTEKIIKQLPSLNIFNVHITFDGPKKYHDKYRGTRGGEPTFDIIAANVETFCRVSKSHLPLSIRVNVTDDNIASMGDFFQSFSPQVKKRSRLYFRYVWSNEVSNFKVFSSDSNQKDSFDKLSKLYDMAVQEGFKIDNPIDEVKFNYCEVDFANHFAIDPLGYIYLCTHTFKPEEAIGNISRDFNEEEISYYLKWINTNPFDDKDCLSCKILPMCLGSCRKSRFYGQKSCLEEKNSLDRYVTNLYNKHSGTANLKKEVE